MTTDSTMNSIVSCGLCRNCAHWTGDKWEHMKTCECPQMDIGYAGTPKTAGNAGVLIEGDEGWGWFTGPDFGCVHFESVSENDQV